MSEKKTLSAEEFDRIFDEGKEDITPYLDTDAIRRPGREIKRVNVDFPAWMVDSLDQEAFRLGVPRQAVIKFAVDAHLKSRGQGSKDAA